MNNQEFANEKDVNKNGSLLNNIEIHCCADCGFFCDHQQKKKIDVCPDCGGTEFEKIHE
ncbi:hypothetical protein PQE66_gp049 [Bacillus phage PBC2]|uniref:Uncharacterized protein n=1 Tax=Bacillus phage PBC2 TaxID=1675029 RepID=A0A218KBU6_9CAUD|nr:hypothetical protein PQE66_gp049 [Bacillus phage PBC2]AKQ08364.1 hypothetical protein PBC2_049 [Bacillus phage PBC2]